MDLTGFHHLTAVSARIADNYRFYTGVMGMRLVKRSVNQDDVSAYHLFYSDAVGSPGNDLTFFDWPVQPERRGSRSIVRTGLRVAGEGALEYWAGRLRENGVTAGEFADAFGIAALTAGATSAIGIENSGDIAIVTAGDGADGLDPNRRLFWTGGHESHRQ